MIPAAAKVSIDGAPVAASEAKISIFDRGLLYGEAVFETLRAYDKRPFRLAAHLDRLHISARAVGLSPTFSAEDLAREVEQAVFAFEAADSYVRIMLTGGDGGLGLLAPAPAPCRRIVVVDQLRVPAPGQYEQGIHGICTQISRPLQGSPAAAAKVTSYLYAILAVREARERGGDDALLLGSQGRVLEAASSNIFVVRGRTLRTPPLGEILPGITRAEVLQIAPALGFDVEEAPLDRDDLLASDEAFLTSTLRELMPLVRVDGQAIGGGLKGPVTRALARAYHDVARAP